MPTNKGASLPFTNWNEEWCQCSKEKAYHGELLNREGVKKIIIKKGMCGLPSAACGFPLISSEKEMAEAIPPDNSQLVCVGEVCCPKSVRKESERLTLCLCNSSSLPE